MEGVTVVDHPLVQHKLTLIRDKNRSTKSFRELLKEIGMLLCYEVTRDLPLTDVEIETPLARMIAPRIAGKKLVFAPVLRAGMTFAEGATLSGAWPLPRALKSQFSTYGPRIAYAPRPAG